MRELDNRLMRHIDLLVERYPSLESAKNDIVAAYLLLEVIGLTGAKDSKLKDMSDVCIKAPQTETYMIQELHLPIYHCLCLMLEEKFFG